MQKNEIRILFEDEHFAIAVKGIGDDPQSFFKNYFKEKQYAEAVNRLDKPVSGLVIIAFTKDVHTQFNILLKTGNIKKEYWAICKKNGSYELNRKYCVENYISFNTKIQKGFVRNKNKNTKKSLLHWELAGEGKNYYFLRVYPVTGRTHQIRIQLADLGMPIKGDIKYGFPRTEKTGGIRLHAYSLQFIHPITKKNIECAALPFFPDTLWSECIKACSLGLMKDPLSALSMRNLYPEGYEANSARSLEGAL